MSMVQLSRQEHSLSTVAGDRVEGRLVKRARLLQSALSHPDYAAVRLSPQPRGSLSNLVAVPLPRTQPEPHEVGTRPQLPVSLHQEDCTDV